MCLPNTLRETQHTGKAVEVWPVLFCSITGDKNRRIFFLLLLLPLLLLLHITQTLSLN